MSAPCFRSSASASIFPFSRPCGEGATRSRPCDSARPWHRAGGPGCAGSSSRRRPPDPHHVVADVHVRPASKEERDDLLVAVHHRVVQGRAPPPDVDRDPRPRRAPPGRLASRPTRWRRTGRPMRPSPPGPKAGPRPGGEAPSCECTARSWRGLLPPAGPILPRRSAVKLPHARPAAQRAPRLGRDHGAGRASGAASLAQHALGSAGAALVSGAEGLQGGEAGGREGSRSANRSYASRARCLRPSTWPGNG